MGRGGQHTVPSGARENRPFAGQESPLSRSNVPPGLFLQLETLNIKRGTCLRRFFPHLVPDLPALYGLFRAKKISFYFFNYETTPGFSFPDFAYSAYSAVHLPTKNRPFKTWRGMSRNFRQKPYVSRAVLRGLRHLVHCPTGRSFARNSVFYENFASINSP